ncbi:MAG: hypothetical protein OXG15_14550 [Gammaproteobacteria bacterium]|nr:hypothetical protein [Gammaproteobacteria bacterium]
MDLLNQKGLLLAICLVGAVLLAADEDQSDEAPQKSRLSTDDIHESQSEKTPVDEDDPPTGPVRDTKQSSQATELKPLELKERIRAHANIDLPQDI